MLLCFCLAENTPCGFGNGDPALLYLLFFFLALLSLLACIDLAAFLQLTFLTGMEKMEGL